MHMPRPRRLLPLLASVSVLSLGIAGVGPYDHSPSPQSTPAPSGTKTPHVGLLPGERKSAAELRRERALKRQRADEAYTRGELRRAYRAINLVGTTHEGGKTVFLPPVLLARKLDAYSRAHFDKLELLGYFVVDKKPKSGPWGGGDMNALEIDRDSTPTHVVAYVDTMQNRLYELDVFPDAKALITTPDSKDAKPAGAKAKAVSGVRWGHWAAFLALFAACSYLVYELTGVTKRRLSRLLKARRERREEQARRRRWQSKIPTGYLSPAEPLRGQRVTEATWVRTKEGDDVILTFNAFEWRWDDDTWRREGQVDGYYSGPKRWSSATDALPDIVAAWVEFSAWVAADNARRFQRAFDEQTATQLELEGRERKFEEHWQVAELLPSAHDATYGLSFD
jgi:hypothetical protein